MARIGQLTLSDADGTKYTFQTYDLQTNFNSVGVVYVFTRRPDSWCAQRYSHKIIYIGETGDINERFGNHHKANCINTHKTNCIGILLESKGRSRLSYEDKLVVAYDPPCNG